MTSSNQTTLQTTDHQKIRIGTIGTETIVWMVKRGEKWVTVTEEVAR